MERTHATARKAPNPGAVTAERFKAAFRHHPGGVSLVTADAGTGPVALTATSVSSVSVDPNVLTFSVSVMSSASPVISRADTVVIHLLDSDHLELAKLGATTGVDRFADTAQWSRMATGEPLFHVVRRWIRAEVIGRIPTGSATVIVAQALDVGLGDDGHSAAPLVYHNRSWHRLGAASQFDD